ncbi:PREDICTED: inter-alpha-trypsin inhibitor heavy chain H3-like isoform X4 [Nelumbo nucifera]|uniref:Inter-alpha-trypsin inhibitor heavy chain H3-like isoform X4 n=1 Tax=Nelumbo nucifera TaxID=4432 RepID=A0A1U8AZN6_NELNU|nr:PREDICTED: inter-alpha-trypsin inhibitor heavy chain H3-like isoform X4 [Nelumbo nucifera]
MSFQMVDYFVESVEDGLRLSKRIYFGKDRSVSPPRPASMDKSLHQTYLPTAPMVYAVVSDPAIVDNPDLPSYQPYVHGKCDPPALIPLQMNGIAVEADCYLGTAFVTVSGSWRVHCIMGSRNCDCRLAIPMSERGSVLGVEVDVIRKSYRTQLIKMEENMDIVKVSKVKDGGFLKPHIFTMTIPEIDGGSNLSIKFSWSQKLLYNDGQFSLNIPFSFPEYVSPAGKKIPKREKIQLNVNAGSEMEVLCRTSSHPLKEIRRQAGRLGFSYEADVLAWSSVDFTFSYMICSSGIHGSLLLQPPLINDFDQREMFFFYLFPGNDQNRKVFRKAVVFVVDISGSMQGRPLESVKNGLCASLSELNPEDSFNIIAFNGETYLFSPSMEMATKEAIQNASQWISVKFVAGGGTSILLPLNQAIEMLSKTCDSIPLIFLITDGSVEDERHICEVMKTKLKNRGSMSPRISTFGIGAYCNHYFLQMLALIGRGHYDAAYDIDLIYAQLQKLLGTASSIILANISIDALEQLDGLEVYPYHLPDLLSGCPLIVSGRYQGSFPHPVKVRGILGDMSSFTIDLKVQKSKDIPLDKVRFLLRIKLIYSLLKHGSQRANLLKRRLQK